MVFYRKYRPQAIDDLDNAGVRETLFSILANPPHAFLFTGPKGLGKTSTARIIAKAVNCQNKKSGVEPCNKCDVCLSITNGTNMDVIEIDAASNRGIDEIRDLKEKIRLAPISATKKVYIIDEVHMLTTEAFNALLKTLEEPPEHALFILATTEPHKVPATILSRCFHLSFSPATEEELLRAFKRIVKAEKIEIDEDALALIAQSSDRGFRDGVKLLEEVSMLANGKQITRALVEEKSQSSGMSQFVSSMFVALQKKDTKEGLEVIGKVVSQGTDVKFFVQQLMQELHEALLTQVGLGEKKAQSLSVSEIQTMFALFSQASAEMKFAVLPQLPLELAVVEYCQSKSQAPLTDIKVESENISEQRKSGEKDPSTSLRMTPVDEGVTVSSLRREVGMIKRNEALYGETVKPTPKPKPLLPSVDLMHVPAKGEMTKEWLDCLWQHIILDMKQHNHTIAGLLRSCQIKSYDATDLIIQAAYPFHKDKLDDAKTRDALINVCKILTGKDVSVTVELKK